MISVNIGSDKIVNFRRWKGREKRIIQEKIANGDFDLINYLIYSACEDPNVFINDNEKNYCFLKLRESCFNDKNLDFSWVCPTCGEDSLLSKKTKDLEKFVKLSSFDTIKVQDYDFHFSHPVYETSFIKDTIENEVNVAKKFILEMIFCIHKVEKDGIELNLVPDEILNILDNMEIIDLTFMIDSFKEMSFKFNPTLDLVCEHCGFQDTVDMDILPNFEKEWL